MFAVKKPENVWVKYFDVKYWKFGREDSAIEKRFPFTHDSTTNLKVRGLSPNEVYQFSMKYVTSMGTSPSGPESSPVVTRPCSVPTNLRVKDKSSTSFSVLWDPPLHYGAGVHITKYEVTVMKGKMIF